MDPSEKSTYSHNLFYFQAISKSGKVTEQELIEKKEILPAVGVYRMLGLKNKKVKMFFL